MSEAQRRVEQLVLHVRALQLLNSALTHARDEVRRNRLQLSTTVKAVRVCACVCVLVACVRGFVKGELSGSDHTEWSLQTVVFGKNDCPLPLDVRCADRLTLPPLGAEGDSHPLQPVAGTVQTPARGRRADAPGLHGRLRHRRQTHLRTRRRAGAFAIRTRALRAVSSANYID